MARLMAPDEALLGSLIYPMLMVLLMVDESAWLTLSRTCRSADSRSHVNQGLAFISDSNFPPFHSPGREMLDVCFISAVDVSLMCVRCHYPLSVKKIVIARLRIFYMPDVYF